MNNRTTYWLAGGIALLAALTAFLLLPRSRPDTGQAGKTASANKGSGGMDGEPSHNSSSDPRITKATGRVGESAQLYDDLKTLYGTTKVALAKEATTDMLQMMDRYVDILERQIQAPSAEEQKAASGGSGFTYTLADLEFADFGKTAGLSDEQDREIRKHYKEFQLRLLEKAKRDRETFRKNPAQLSAVYLASDAAAENRISKEDQSARTSETGIDPSQSASPRNLVGSLRKWREDPELVSKIRSLLDQGQAKDLGISESPAPVSGGSPMPAQSLDALRTQIRELQHFGLRHYDLQPK